LKFSLGLIVVVVAIVFFYIRIAILRGRKKRYFREYALKRRKVKGRSKGAALPAPAPGSPPFGVNSWLLVALCILVMVAGIIMYNNMAVFGIHLIQDPQIVSQYSKLWYIPVAVGIFALSFCITIEKPRFDEDDEEE